MWDEVGLSRSFQSILLDIQRVPSHLFLWRKSHLNFSPLGNLFLRSEVVGKSSWPNLVGETWVGWINTICPDSRVMIPLFG